MSRIEDEIKQYRILWHTYEERIEIDKKVMKEFYIPKEENERCNMIY